MYVLEFPLRDVMLRGGNSADAAVATMYCNSGGNIQQMLWRILIQHECWESVERCNPEAEFLDEIQTKVLRVFFLAIDSRL